MSAPATAPGGGATVEGRGPVVAARHPNPGGRAHGAEGRDRSIDGLRAYAIGGVVFGHWLVTALVPGSDGGLRLASPLGAMPALAPATWFLQTLGLFFFVSGYAGARSLDTARRRRTAGPSGTGGTAGTGRRPGAGGAGWLWRRLSRLATPVGALLGCWAALLAGAALVGMPGATLRSVATLVVSPLWFLLPLVVLTALTGPLVRLCRRYGPVRPAAAVLALVALGDLAGYALPGSAGWRTPLAVLAGWLLPYLLGVATAGGRFGSRRDGWWLMLGGAAAMGVLVFCAGYPASAVGVPGDGRSNLDPPSLFAVALALAQVGAALLVRPALARLLARPRWWRPVRRLNSAAIGVYLWHQSVLVGVTTLAALGGRLAGTPVVPGLHSAPDGPVWLAARLGWLPLLALVLAVLARPRAVESGPAAAPAQGCPGRG
ncbi:acyltransferase family protein [Plantactinospora sp. CA-290183]|uniref:acyltransferase family protein n=1 Tax=Plantactinospora sp. CA-290183 TaxID=3240006 RepID=UPI003D8E1E6E